MNPSDDDNKNNDDRKHGMMDKLKQEGKQEQEGPSKPAREGEQKLIASTALNRLVPVHDGLAKLQAISSVKPTTNRSNAQSTSLLELEERIERKIQTNSTCIDEGQEACKDDDDPSPGAVAAREQLEAALVMCVSSNKEKQEQRQPVISNTEQLAVAAARMQEQISRMETSSTAAAFKTHRTRNARGVPTPRSSSSDLHDHRHYYSGEASPQRLNTQRLAVAIPVTEEQAVNNTNIPSAVEYDPSSNNKNKHSKFPPICRNERFQLYSLFVAFVLLLLVVGVGVGVARASGCSNRGDGSSQTSKKPEVPAAYRDAVEQVIGKVLHGENSSSSSTPYLKALDWITFHDPQGLSPADANFLQRYILAYFYYATSMEKPWGSCGPPPQVSPGEDKNNGWATAIRLGCTYNRQFSRFFYDQSREGFRWLSSKNECLWAGVDCDGFDQVRSIQLRGLNMTGTFPDGIWYLPFLQELRIEDGELKGKLPKEAATMKHLQTFTLSDNDFTGRIPQEWFQFRMSRLLHVGGNQITGSISSEIKNLRTIRGLSLEQNNLFGRIPTEIGLLTNLRRLYLSENLLVGTIPSEFGRMELLRQLDLFGNDLEGTIPTTLAKISRLEQLRIQDNEQVSGELPKGILTDHMGILNTQNCNLTGEISEHFQSERTFLFILNIRNNQFWGTLPDNMGDLVPGLRRIDLAGNDLTGTIPDSLCDQRGQWFHELVADCAASQSSSAASVLSPEIFCRPGCCTECCDHEGRSCLPV